VSGKPYDLHLLGTPTHEEEHLHYTDPAAAVIAFNQLACEARRPAILSIAGSFPGMVAEVVGVYSPSADAPAIKVRLGKARPAFTEPKTEVEPRESKAERLGEEDREDRMHAAVWYAKGFIDCIGGLSPFDYEDAAAFAQWHVETSYGDGFYPIPEQWATWSAQRRQETGL
jgi:hypothetical protein